MKQWIDECTKTHAFCTTTSSLEASPPARLIAVVDPVQNTPVIRLIETSDIAGQLRYITLSHCWFVMLHVWLYIYVCRGGADIPNKTTLAKIDGYKQDIPFAVLPKTFQDAVTVTRLLNVPYLWVDCLCIVQDSATDWEREAAKMASIFENAVCTITAASAANCFAGLGISAALPPAAQFEVPQPANAPAGSLLKFSARRPRELCDPRALYPHSPLHARGWILQEMVLSQRIAHFLDGALLWQCNMKNDEPEAGPGLAAPPRADLPGTYSLRKLALPSSYGDEAGIAAAWWNTVADYSRRELSFPADGMAAFSGITKSFAARLKHQPVLGLWSQNLPYHLAWEATPPSSSTQPLARTPNIPTWSWFSILHAAAAISHPAGANSRPALHFTGSFVFAHAATVRGVDIAWSGEPMTSALLRGTVTLRTRTASLTRIARGMMRDFSIPDWTRAQVELALDLSPGGVPAAGYKRVFETVLLYMQAGRPGAPWRVTYLVVEQTGVRKGEYQRIGVARVTGYPPRDPVASHNEADEVSEAIVQRVLQNMSKEVDISLV